MEADRIGTAELREKLREAASAISAEYWLLAVGALGQIVFRLITFSVSYDYVFLLGSALCFLRRGHFANFVVSVKDLSSPFDVPMTQWPPGFSFCVAILTRVLGGVYAAMVGFDLIFMAIFFAACGLLLARMAPSFPKRARLLSAFTLAFVAPSYVEYGTNVASLGLFLVSLVLILPGRDDRPPSLVACSLAGVLSAFTIGFRYASGPASLVPILVLGVAGRRSRDGRARLLAAAVGWVAGFAPLLAWLARTRVTGLAPLRLEGRWFPENLLRLQAFAGDALFGRHLTSIFPRSTYHFIPNVDMLQYELRHLLSVVVLLAAIVGIRELIRHSRGTPEGAVIRRIFIVGGVASLATIAMLVLLTVRHAPVMFMGQWVYMEAARYYAVCLPFIVFGAAMIAASSAKDWVPRTLKVLALAIFLVAGVAWAYEIPSAWRQIRRSHVGGPIDAHLDEGGGFADGLRRLTASDMPNASIEFGGSVFSTWLHGALATGFDVPFATVLNGETPHARKDVNVIACVSLKALPEHQQAFDTFCREHAGQPERIGDCVFCRVLLRGGA